MVRGDVLEAANLLVLRKQVEERVEHDVHERIRAGDADLREVAHRHIDGVAPGLGPELLDHRRGEVDAVDANARSRERQRDPAGADRELERGATFRELGQDHDRRVLVVALHERVVDRGVGFVEAHDRLVALHRGDWIGRARAGRKRNIRPWVAARGVERRRSGSV